MVHRWKKQHTLSLQCAGVHKWLGVLGSLIRHRIGPALIIIGYGAFMNEVWIDSPSKAIIQVIIPILVFLLNCYLCKLVWYEAVYWFVALLIKLPLTVAKLFCRLLFCR